VSGSAPHVQLLEHGYLLTLDEHHTRGRLSVAVADDVVIDVDTTRALRDRHPHAHRVSCRGRIIMPGLVNAHLHPELHLLKGALEQLGLHDWSGARFYNDAIAFLDTVEGRDAQHDAIDAAIAECALGGITGVGTYGVTTGADHASAHALASIGLNGTVTIRDAAFRDVLQSGSTRYDVAPFYRLHAEEALHEPELAAAAAAHARGARIVMHAAETQHRVAIARERFGMTTIRLLAERGLLSPRVLLSHAVHVDDDEIALIARTGAHVVVSPAAEMKLGDGIPPVARMIQRGVNVALGTDAAVCNNGTDMFLEMRLLGLSQKLRDGAAAMPAEQILLMGTRNGAAALGLPTPGIASGARADLVLVDATGPRMQPLVLDGTGSNLVANLVYAATASDVTDVMANGRWIVRRRRLRTAPAAQLWRRLAAHAIMLDRQLRLEP